MRKRLTSMILVFVMILSCSGLTAAENALSPVRRNAAEDLLLIVDFQNVYLPGYEWACPSMPEAVTIFLAPPSIEALEQRLRGRGTETEEKILGRLETARKEIELAPNYDYTVINENSETAAEEIDRILDGEE